MYWERLPFKGELQYCQRAAGDDQGKQAGDKVELTGVFCLGHCTDAVSVQIGEEIFSVNTDNVGEFFKNQVLAKV